MRNKHMGPKKVRRKTESEEYHMVKCCFGVPYEKGTLLSIGLLFDDLSDEQLSAFLLENARSEHRSQIKPSDSLRHFTKGMGPKRVRLLPSHRWLATP